MTERRSLTAPTLARIIDGLDVESALYKQIMALAGAEPPPVDTTPTYLLEPGQQFADYEVWITSGERNAEELARHIRAAGSPCRVVPQSVMVVGDFWVVHKGTQVMKIIERKSIQDLLASRNDGRWIEQPTRMILSGAPMLFIYVTGSLLWIDNMEDRTAVQSMIVHLETAHPRLRVEFGTDESVTANVMHKHCQYTRMYLEETDLVDTVPEVEQIKKECQKRQLDNQRDVWMVQVCCVKGMSLNRAKEVIKRYRSASHYLEEVRTAPNERARRDLLTELTVPVRNGFRKLGPTLSSRFYDCMLADADEFTHERHVVKG